MAMDNHHHLEGVLERPGIFRVYLYDSHTQPLAPDRMKQASGTVLVGDSDDTPEIPLKLSRDGRTLEAVLDSRIELPVALTLLLRFPGMARDAKPELFTFPFREYSQTGPPGRSRGNTNGRAPQKENRRANWVCRDVVAVPV
jgi:hypothetical protein